MITPQFTYDKTGKKVGVFLAIEDWDQLEKIPGVDELSQTNTVIPEWQIKLGEEALQSIANGTADLVGWEEAKKQFKL